MPSPQHESRLTTSRELLARAKAGDREALSTLFQRLLPSLHRWAHGRLPAWARGAADTADVIQDAVVRAIPRLSQFEPRHREALRSYLRQAVRNRIVDEIRSIQRHGIHQPLDSDAPARLPNAEEASHREQVRNFYRVALEQLNPADRELVVARMEMGYTYEQLALITGRATPDSARMALKRALVRLAEAMHVGR